MNYHIIDEVDITIIREELERLPEYESQIMLQGVEEGGDPFYGTGYAGDIDHAPEDFVVPLWDNIPYINSLLRRYNMARSRVLRMESKTCYTWHKDDSSRYQIPVYTSEFSKFIIEDEVFNMDEGNLYLIDTWKEHTALNASFVPRIHIVGNNLDCPNKREKPNLLIDHKHEELVQKNESI